MRHTLIFILLYFAKTSFGQDFHIVYRNSKDSSQNLYAVRPPKGLIKGLLVLNDRALSDSAKVKAYESGILTLSVLPASNSLDNLTSDSIIVRISEMIKEVLTNYKVPDNKFIIGGMSVAGTSAIRYTQYCFTKKTKSAIKPMAVFAVDPPLDYERLWSEAEKSVQRNYNVDAVEEGKNIMKFLKKELHGEPKNNIKAYRIRSPYCNSALNGGNAYLLNNTTVKLYIEPDIEWWLVNRGKDFYDINAVDNAGLINQLKLNGNKQADLIVSSNKGYREDGNKHPHSWSILNEIELLTWCEKLFSDKK
jgi:hypothetical protein